MKGLYFDGTRLAYRDDLPKPERKKGEALIKVGLAGICRTDLEITKGYMGFTGIPGHEFVGTVEEADDDSLTGSRVAGEINCGCGECEDCRLDNHKHCQNRTVLGIDGRDGAFAEYITLPERNLFPVPDNIEDEDAVFAEPLAAAFRVVEQIKVIDTDILVMGDGKLGLLIAETLAFLRANVTLAGKHQEKMDLLRDTNVTCKTPDELKEGRKYDAVVDATGRRESLQTSFSRVKPKGYLIIKTTVADPDCLDLNKIVIDEINVVGSRCGPFEHSLALLEQEFVKVGKYRQATYPLADGLKAFEEAAAPGAMKVLLKP